MGIETIEEIFDTVKDSALISKWSGGIGLHVSSIDLKSRLMELVWNHLD